MLVVTQIELHLALPSIANLPRDAYIASRDKRLRLAPAQAILDSCIKGVAHSSVRVLNQVILSRGSHVARGVTCIPWGLDCFSTA